MIEETLKELVCQRDEWMEKKAAAEAALPGLLEQLRQKPDDGPSFERYHQATHTVALAEQQVLAIRARREQLLQDQVQEKRQALDEAEVALTHWAYEIRQAESDLVIARRRQEEYQSGGLASEESGRGKYEQKLAEMNSAVQRQEKDLDRQRGDEEPLKERRAQAREDLRAAERQLHDFREDVIRGQA